MSAIAPLSRYSSERFVRPALSDEQTGAKYALPGETSYRAVHHRVAQALFAGDPRAAEFAPVAEQLMNRFAIMTAGRILASAGSGRRTTMINCFVNQVVDDDMNSIMAANTRAALTMQAGGGIGTDFSTVRPKGAIVASVGSVASGPLSFMDMWNAMCLTIMSGGSRRGAMMATMSDDHPDLPAFIVAKREKGRLTNFNLSVLVSDAFMQAIKADAMWNLGFGVAPADPAALVDTLERNGKPWYVYRRLPARELWGMILRNTYDWAEPGVIFIDRINDWNNLNYAELIRCTNPCGEQPLPPNGACNLGSVIVSAFVIDAFTPSARFDFDACGKATAVLVRMQDNVTDLTYFPVDEQRVEAQSKRRIGIGTLALADALLMLGVGYGTDEGVEMTRAIKRAVRDAAYQASVELAEERGAFPLFDAEKYLARPFIQALPASIREGISKHGIRNACLLSDAPNGTTAIHAGNLSSGIEPVFALEYTRAVLQPDGSRRDESVTDPAYRLYCDLNGLDPASKDTRGHLPAYFIDAQTLSVEGHVRMQAACQEFVDGSISKTVNCPEDITFEEFQSVYELAYELGCKGITTYRPSGVRGSVLKVEKPAAEAAPAPVPAPVPASRKSLPDRLDGVRVRVKNPDTDENIYFIINHSTDPVTGCRKIEEVFVQTFDENSENVLSTATIAISNAYRYSDPSYVNDLMDTFAKKRGQLNIWHKGNDGKARNFNHLLPLLVFVIRNREQELAEECAAMTLSRSAQPATVPSTDAPRTDAQQAAPRPSSRHTCPKCGSTNLKYESGCLQCLDCGAAKCG